MYVFYYNVREGVFETVLNEKVFHQDPGYHFRAKITTDPDSP